MFIQELFDKLQKLIHSFQEISAPASPSRPNKESPMVQSQILSDFLKNLEKEEKSDLEKLRILLERFALAMEQATTFRKGKPPGDYDAVLIAGHDTIKHLLECYFLCALKNTKSEKEYSNLRLRLEDCLLRYLINIELQLPLQKSTFSLKDKLNRLFPTWDFFLSAKMALNKELMIRMKDRLCLLNFSCNNLSQTSSAQYMATVNAHILAALQEEYSICQNHNADESSLKSLLSEVLTPNYGASVKAKDLGDDSDYLALELPQDQQADIKNLREQAEREVAEYLRQEQKQEIQAEKTSTVAAKSESYSATTIIGATSSVGQAAFASASTAAEREIKTVVEASQIQPKPANNAVEAKESIEDIIVKAVKAAEARLNTEMKAKLENLEEKLRQTQVQVSAEQEIAARLESERAENAERIEKLKIMLCKMGEQLDSAEDKIKVVQNSFSLELHKRVLAEDYARDQENAARETALVLEAERKANGEMQAKLRNIDEHLRDMYARVSSAEALKNAAQESVNAEANLRAVAQAQVKDQIKNAEMLSEQLRLQVLKLTDERLTSAERQAKIQELERKLKETEGRAAQAETQIAAEAAKKITMQEAISTVTAAPRLDEACTQQNAPPAPVIFIAPQSPPASPEVRIQRRPR